jgi:hypothetical protein
LFMEMESSIYALAYNLTFKNSGVEKKYLQQTNIYFRASLKFLQIFIPVILTVSSQSPIPILISLCLYFTPSLYFIRFAIFYITTFHSSSDFLSLISDWLSHIYTLRHTGSYLFLGLLKLFFWHLLDHPWTLDHFLCIFLLFYLTCTTQARFRELWADMESNKRKLMQEKTILNEIQSGVLIFTASGTAVSANHKAQVFLKTRGIATIDQLRYYEIFPECCQSRVKNMFTDALQGIQKEEEFLLSHELEPIPPLFSAVMVSLKAVEHGQNTQIHMSVVENSNAVMRRRFLASNERMIEETSAIIEEEFTNLYLHQKPLKNRHMRSLNLYLLAQRDLLVLMDNYLGESEVINEFFEIKNEIVNSVHICWRGAKIKKMSIVMICDSALPKQVFGDSTKHNQLLKSLVEFAILTGEMNSEISINCSLYSFSRSAAITYKIVFYSKSLRIEELDFIFRVRKDSEQPKLLEEMIEISEKYGLSIAIFDALLTIYGGYVLELDFQENINRVIISYV